MSPDIDSYLRSVFSVIMKKLIYFLIKINKIILKNYFN